MREFFQEDFFVKSNLRGGVVVVVDLEWEVFPRWA